MSRFPIQGIISIAQKERQIGEPKHPWNALIIPLFSNTTEFIEVVGDAVGRLPEDVL
jgi:hypothetical protein